MMSGVLMMMAAVAAFPPNPKRESPPPDLEQNALAVGASVKPFSLPDANGGKWSLLGTSVIVFYRGHW